MIPCQNQVSLSYFTGQNCPRKKEGVNRHFQVNWDSQLVWYSLQKKLHFHCTILICWSCPVQFSMTFAICFAEYDAIFSRRARFKFRSSAFDNRCTRGMTTLILPYQFAVEQWAWPLSESCACVDWQPSYVVWIEAPSVDCTDSEGTDVLFVVGQTDVCSYRSHLYCYGNQIELGSDRLHNL